MVQLNSAILIFAVSTATTQAARVLFHLDHTCSTGGAFEFQEPACNRCFDPPGDWWAVQISDIGPNQRVSAHNQDSCTSASSVGQGYGPHCRIAGGTAIRSLWISCDGQRVGNGNTTESETGPGNATETGGVDALPTLITETIPGA